MHVFPLETARLRMRPLSAEDEALYVHLYTDAETMRFIGPPLTAARAARSFRLALDGMQCNPIERLFLIVIEKSTATAVGFCSLQNYDVQRRSAQVGIMLIAAARARGYSKEALIGLVQGTFSDLPIDELWAQFASADHIAGQRTAGSAGFVLLDEAVPAGEPTSRGIWSARRGSWSPPAGSRQHSPPPGEQA